MKRLRRTPEIVLLIAALACAWLGFAQLHSRAAIVLEENGAGRKLENMQSASEVPEIFEEFQPLLAQNPQIVGMVGVDGRAMYVCQADDNRHYMNHRFDGTEDDAGMIFLDCRASIWPRSENLILYGHNRRDGSRFGTLKRYLDAEYLLEHPEIRLATLYEMHDYLPIAIFRTTIGEFDWEKFSFSDEADFQRFISDAQARSELPISMKATYKTPLLTLVTCSGRADDERLVLICIQKDEGDAK